MSMAVSIHSQNLLAYQDHSSVLSGTEALQIMLWGDVQREGSIHSTRSTTQAL